MIPERQRWVDAARVLGRDPTARVQCPVCQIAVLEVVDVYPSEGPGFERRLRCSGCAAHNVMRMPTSSTNGEPAGVDDEPT